MVTSAFGSVLPVTSLPASFTFAVGASGGVVSGALISVLGETLPASSLALTVRSSPFVWGGDTVIL